MYNEQLLSNEAEYHLKNYWDWGRCYNDNTPRDLYNSSDDMKADFNNIVLLLIQNNS